MIKFWHEIRRRHVLRIAGVYCAVGWLMIEIIANVFPMFGAPDWIAQTITFLIILFFPITLVITWAFEITPDGIKYDNHQADGDEVLPSALPDYFVGLGLILILAFMVFNSGTQPPEEAATTEDQLTLAVMPLVDFSADDNNQYLGNGIAETVLNSLASIQGLQVASRTSSFALQSDQLDVKEIGARLDVDRVLEGSIRRSGDRLRVSAQLSDTSTGFQIWSNKYDRRFEDIFAIEEDIAGSIVDALVGQLPIEQPLQLATGTRNAEAYNLTLKGLYYFDRPTQANFVLATQLFQQATSIDPDYGLAHGYLAYCIGYASIYANYSTYAVQTGISVELALRQDPENIPALLIKGFMLRHPDEAFPYFEAARVSGRERDLALYTYHNAYLWPQGRQEEARLELQQALAENPSSVLLQQPLSMLESRAGNYDLALNIISRTASTDGSEFLVSSVLADVYYRSGNAQKLKEAAEQSIEKLGLQNGFMYQYLIAAHVMLGDIEAARELLEEAIAVRNSGVAFSASTIGLGYASLREMDNAANWLVQANREKDFWLTWHLNSKLEHFPVLAAHPDIIKLQKDMGLDAASIESRRLSGH